MHPGWAHVMLVYKETEPASFPRVSEEVSVPSSSSTTYFEHVHQALLKSESCALWFSCVLVTHPKRKQATLRNRPTKQSPDPPLYSKTRASLIHAHRGWAQTPWHACTHPFPVSSRVPVVQNQPGFFMVERYFRR